MDLISRQAALDAMGEYYWSIMGDKPPKLDEKTALYVDLKQAVKRLPTIEPKRGKWMPVTNGRGGHECDQCHEYAPSWQTGEEHLTNYCPYCGAKMEESE